MRLPRFDIEKLCVARSLVGIAASLSNSAKSESGSVTGSAFQFDSELEFGNASTFSVDIRTMPVDGWGWYVGGTFDLERPKSKLTLSDSTGSIVLVT